MQSPNILRYGRAEPNGERVPLRAGPLTLLYENGDLRAIKLGEVEVLRRITVAVRDRNWGTVAPSFSTSHPNGTQSSVDIGADSFHITYTVENIRDEIDFTWQADISGDAGGVITFRMAGVARSTFMKNRIGFCVLHPAGAAGAAGASCVVTHVDGAIEQGVLPEYIVPDQPVKPFANMQALRHEAAPGVWAEVQFSGDVFEMEDQRNWTDASYKTFCTPLHLPFPAQILAGTRVEQTIRLAVIRDSANAKAATAPQLRPLTFTLQPEIATSLPHIGLGVASHAQPLTHKEVTLLKALHLRHLRVDLRLSDPAYPDALRRAEADARQLGVPLEVAVLVAPEGGVALRQLANLVDELQPDIIRWLIYPEVELSTRASMTEPAVLLALQHLASVNPDAEFASGTNTDFIFMQNHPPPYALLDMACLAMNPQSHAFDNASLMETLQTQATVVATARHVAGGKPIVVSPVTLKPRFNPYATGAVPATPPGHLPPQVDPRQMALFGAAWTAGSIKYLSQGGAFSATYYETTGWRGVMETETGSSEPDLFPSLPGAVFPLYHILADAGEFSGGDVVGTVSSDPLRVDGLALQKNGRLRLIVANMTNAPQEVAVACPGNVASVKIIDETNAEEAMRSPHAFRHRAGNHRELINGVITLALLPYAVARLDLI